SRHPLCLFGRGRFVRVRSGRLVTEVALRHCASCLPHPSSARLPHSGRALKLTASTLGRRSLQRRSRCLPLSSSACQDAPGATHDELESAPLNNVPHLGRAFLRPGLCGDDRRLTIIIGTRPGHTAHRPRTRPLYAADHDDQGRAHFALS
ncbi:hypothetical protein BD311DRAFT_558895, partial [Dichomitus squalens]